jgi:RNA polymerase primary sigma factor
MREMGSVELLTREGEIEIAKRIEDGLKHMVMAISACPTTIAEILEHADRIAAGATPIDEVVDGLVDETEGFPAASASGGDEEEDEGEETTDLGASGMTAGQLEQLKARALEKFELVRKLFDKMRVAFEKEGYKSPGYVKAQTRILDELMGLRFTAKMVERLCDSLRRQVEEVRSIEKQIYEIMVNKCGMPRPLFLKHFPGNETSTRWVTREADGGHPYSEVLLRNLPAVHELQGKLSDLQKRIVNSYIVYSASGDMVLKVTTSEFGQLVTRNYRMVPPGSSETTVRMRWRPTSPASSSAAPAGCMRMFTEV